MNNPYRYVGLPLIPRMAQELILELFTGQTAHRQEIIRVVDGAHRERGGQPARSILHPAGRSLSTMKKSGLAENPRYGFWSILSNSTEGTPERVETTEPTHIKTLDAFLEWASRFDSEKKSTKYLFRGVSNVGYKIDASAYRRVKKGGGGDEKPDEDFERFLQLNRDMISDARFRGHDWKNGRKFEDLEVLAEFQHYGAATCLIDFTYNPLVALWFACKPESDNSSKGCCKCSKKCCPCKQNPKVSPGPGKVVAVRPNDSTEFREITLKFLKKKIDYFFQDNKSSMHERLYQWQPRHQNNRILAQQSIFLFGVLEINPDPNTECTIDGSSKEKIRESLKQIYGITEDMLFPDFDGFARQHSQDLPYTQRTVSQYMERGVGAYQKQEYKGAIAYFDMTIDRDSAYAEAYYQRGLAKFHQKEYTGAITDFDMTIDRDSAYAEAYYQRGLANANLREYEAAAEDYDAAIRLGLNTAEVYYQRGLANINFREYEAAAEDYDTAIRLGLNTAEVYYQRGNANARLREYEAALEDYDEAIRLGLNTSEIYYNRGIMSALLEVYEAAFEDYDEAIRLGLNTSEIYYSRGSMLYQIGNFEEAEQDFQTALQLARQVGDESLIVEIEQDIRDMDLNIGEPQ